MAESLEYYRRGTSLLWLPAGGGGDYDFTPTDLGSGKGWLGEFADLGAQSSAGTPSRWTLRAFGKPGGTRTAGDQLHVYFGQGDGSHYDYDSGTGDVAITSLLKLANFTRVGELKTNQTASAVSVSKVWTIELFERYFAPALWNPLTNAWSSTSSDYGFILTQVPAAQQPEA